MNIRFDKKKSHMKSNESGRSSQPGICQSRSTDSYPVDPDEQVNHARRTCMKMVSGAAIATGGLSVMPAAALPLAKSFIASASSASMVESGSIGSNLMLPNLAINININRSDLPDWMLIENLREAPLVLKQFAPQWLSYNDKLLDLNAMLSRQQRGREQLAIWPNYAWNHSVRGAVRSVHQCVTFPQACFDASQLSTAAIQSGYQSFQLSAHVDTNGVVRLLNV